MADQPSLIAAVTSAADADTATREKWEVATAPNPLHWHFDRISVSDPELGADNAQLLATAWSLQLGGRDQTHEWALL